MSDPPVPDMDELEPTEAPVVSSAAPAEDPPAPWVELWSPRDIGWASVLLGYPGALVLAALNWLRMKQRRKAVIHIGAAFVTGWTLVFAGIAGVGLLLGIAVGYYLYKVQRTDQSSALLSGRVASRSGLLGALITITATLVILGSGAIVAASVGVGGVAHRGEILFATTAAASPCTPVGQVSTFGPSDPIFLVAVMRETVKTGSQVTYEIDGPGLTTGPKPVTAQPPFDCLSTSESIGTLAPGSYRVRYRYDNPSTAADLASGTFTVTAGAEASAIHAQGSAAIVSAPPAATAVTAATAGACPDASAITVAHQAPEIEAALPAAVGGRPLTRWSVRGQCWLELAFDTTKQIDDFVAIFTTPANPHPIDDARLVYGVAGRSDTTTDPPYLVYAAARPEGDDEIGLALALLVGLAGYDDPAKAIDLSNYEATTIAGKDVFVGTVEMLGQNDHQRGKPYLYENDRYMFIVVSDDEAWASEAIGKLP